jgi:hypothetical protein
MVVNSDHGDLDHWLDVDHGRPVDRLHGPDPQARARDLAHGDPVQAKRVGSMRGARRENASERMTRIAPRVNLQRLAIPRCSHVITMSSSPAFMPWSACAKAGSISSQASGAPSVPCGGADAASRRFERMYPMGRSFASSTARSSMARRVGSEIPLDAECRTRCLPHERNQAKAYPAHVFRIPGQISLQDSLLVE